ETQAVGANADGLETQARIAEATLLYGDARAALALADEVLDGARALGMDSALSPLLHRVRGAAFARTREGRAPGAMEQRGAAFARAGDLDAAAGALAESVDAA